MLNFGSVYIPFPTIFGPWFHKKNQGIVADFAEFQGIAAHLAFGVLASDCLRSMGTLQMGERWEGFLVGGCLFTSISRLHTIFYYIYIYVVLFSFTHHIYIRIIICLYGYYVFL